MEGESAFCAVRKDAGDDPDVTNGLLVCARVEKTPEGVSIDGGEGVGRVTKPGLDQPIGAAAINTVPRQMIRAALEAVCAETGDAPEETKPGIGTEEEKPNSYSVLGVLEETHLVIEPFEFIEEQPEGMVQLFVSDDITAGEDEVFSTVPAEFVEVEGVFFARFVPMESGLYTVAPEIIPEEES